VTQAANEQIDLSSKATVALSRSGHGHWPPRHRPGAKGHLQQTQIAFVDGYYSGFREACKIFEEQSRQIYEAARNGARERHLDGGNGEAG